MRSWLHCAACGFRLGAQVATSDSNQGGQGSGRAAVRAFLVVPMGLYDHVKLNNSLFGEDRGHVGQCNSMDDPLMDDYEINEAGRLVHIKVRYEDHSDPKAKDAIGRLAGSMTAVPTGEVEDMNWHGYITVWGNGDYQWRCKFTDGVLVRAEKVAA